jgi:multiple sugar transport system permease protein
MTSANPALAFHGRRQDRRRVEVAGIGWLLPAGALLGIFFLVPVGYSFYLAFTNLELVGPNAQTYRYTGLANVRRLLHDPGFWHSAKLTLIFVVGSGIIAQTVVGMILALLMRKAWAPIRLSVGAIVILAWVLPEISAAFIWYAFSQSGGTLGAILHSHANFLTAAPLLIVSLANVWRNTAFAMLIFSAGLRNVPSEVEESAELEGASGWRRLRSITLPIIKPTIVTTLLLLTLGNLSDFTLIYAMTQGGPGDATSILPIYMYVQAFQFDALGYATTISLALIVIGAFLALFYVRALRREVLK